LVFGPHALEDLRHWIDCDRKKALKISDLIENALASPCEGAGKPEPLKFALARCWSRRIDQERRLDCKVERDALIALACRYHYKARASAGRAKARLRPRHHREEARMAAD
jgi:toxin YoeB